MSPPPPQDGTERGNRRESNHSRCHGRSRKGGHDFIERGAIATARSVGRTRRIRAARLRVLAVRGIAGIVLPRDVMNEAIEEHAAICRVLLRVENVQVPHLVDVIVLGTHVTAARADLLEEVTIAVHGHGETMTAPAIFGARELQGNGGQIEPVNTIAQ